MLMLMLGAEKDDQPAVTCNEVNPAIGQIGLPLQCPESLTACSLHIVSDNGTIRSAQIANAVSQITLGPRPSASTRWFLRPASKANESTENQHGKGNEMSGTCKAVAAAICCLVFLNHGIFSDAQEPSEMSQSFTADLEFLKTDKLSDRIKVVAYESDNRLTNRGQQAWTPETGLPSIWLLGMYNPSPRTMVVIPFEAGEITWFDGCSHAVASCWRSICR